MELWCESCPLSGVCSECGLTFEWAELLSSKRVRPRWNVEFPLRMIDFLVNVPRTLLCSFMPWKFFSSLKMHHEFRPLRIVGYLLILFGLLYVIIVAGVGHQARKQYRESQKVIGATMNVSLEFVVAQAVILPISSHPPGSMSVLATNTRAFWLISHSNAVSTTIGGVPAYNIPLDPPVELFKRRYRFWSGLSFWDVCYGLILPLSSYSSPAMLLLGFLLLASAFSVLCPLGFVLLPESRRVAKVRREHLFRITLYSLAFMAVIMAWITYGLVLGSGYAVPSMHIRIVCLLILPLLQWVWWSVATDKYLKIPHAWGVGASVVVIAYLLGPVLLMCVIIFLATIIA